MNHKPKSKSFLLRPPKRRIPMAGGGVTNMSLSANPTHEEAEATATAPDDLTAGLTFPKPKGLQTKLTRKTLSRILKAISNGAPISSACTIAGISNSTLTAWRQADPEINNRIELARERMRETLLARVKLAAKDDWRASVELLKLSFASDYRRVVQPGEQKHLHIHGDTHVTLPPEKQAELREQRRRILATTKGAHVLAGIGEGPATAATEQEQAEERRTYKIKRQGLLVSTSTPAEPEQPAGEQPGQPIVEPETPAGEQQQPRPDPAFANWHKAAAEERRKEAQDVAEAFIRLR